MAQIAFFSSSRNLPHTLRKRGARENDREAPRLFKSGDAAFFVPKNAFFKDGRYAVACSGTLSCKQALREMLSERGVNERTENDARLLCRAFACFGEKLPEKIQGSYALLVYDCVDRAIYGFCDKTGSKTLYYRLSESGISVATEPSQIANDPYACDKALRAVLRTYLTVGYAVGEGTFYSEVQRLPQGHSLLWQGGKFSLYKWAEYTFAPADLECHSRLEGALKNALQAVPKESALLLSGSVFSSLMAAFSKKEKAVSLSFEGLAQTAIPSRLADLFSLKHETLAFTSSDCLQGAFELAKKSPTPLADPAALSYYLLAKHTSAPIACAEGAAELYGGHRDYYVEEIAKQSRPTLTRYFTLKQS
ncbi:MAG: hypothetical protein J6V82_03090 [Clostridia bacterium]|nr:hypothetical protein [Clostridia bacterium]